MSDLSGLISVKGSYRRINPAAGDSRKNFHTGDALLTSQLQLSRVT